MGWIGRDIMLTGYAQIRHEYCSLYLSCMTHVRDRNDGMMIISGIIFISLKS